MPPTSSARSTLFGPKLYHLYGQGESPMTISGLGKALHADTATRDIRSGSPALASRAPASPSGSSTRRAANLPPGEVGEVITTSDCVMKGYWNNDAANAQALRDGWLWTGDLGSMDADGFVTLKDRSKDLIISGGANIYPREIEEVLLTHAAVLETAVVSRPHADWGEEVIAFIVKRGAPTSPPPSSISSASTTSPASSDPRATASSRLYRRTTTARS